MEQILSITAKTHDHNTQANAQAYSRQLEDFKAVVKCVAEFAQIGSKDIDIDNMNLEQVNSYIETLQTEAMLKFMLMENAVD